MGVLCISLFSPDMSLLVILVGELTKNSNSLADYLVVIARVSVSQIYKNVKYSVTKLQSSTSPVGYEN